MKSMSITISENSLKEPESNQLDSLINNDPNEKDNACY